MDKKGIQMKKIWIIPTVLKKNKKVRVAAYCRVSTFVSIWLSRMDIAYTKYIITKSTSRISME